MSMRVCHWGVVMRLAGCARVHTTYTPAKSEYVSGKRQSVRMARVAYPGDLPELLKFGGEVLGRIDAAGNGFAGQGDVEERIRRDAAELGATHVVFISSYEEEDHLPVQYHTQCAQGSCTTTTSGGERFTRPHAGYVLVRVPHGRWEELPPALGGLGKQPEPWAASPKGSSPAKAADAPSAPASMWTVKRPRSAPGDAAADTADANAPSIEDARRRCKRQATDKFGPDAADVNPHLAAPSERDEKQQSWAQDYAAKKAPDRTRRAAEDRSARKEAAARLYEHCLSRGVPAAAGEQ
jgi:hypothetical protein